MVDGDLVRVCGKGETEKTLVLSFPSSSPHVSIGWPLLSGCCDCDQVVPRLRFLILQPCMIGVARGDADTSMDSPDTRKGGC